MNIATIRVSGVQARTSHSVIVPQGIVGASVTFDFEDSRWRGLTKTAVFQGDVTRDVIVTGNTAVIPAETVANEGTTLKVGVYGVDHKKNLVIPTLWATIGRISSAADPSGDPGTEPDLPIWAQLADDVDKLKRTAYGGGAGEGGVQYRVTNVLTDVNNSNTAVTVTEYGMYFATLTANVGYAINAVKVTMGGVDMTANVYSGGVLMIPSVTDNIVITASAVESAAGNVAVTGMAEYHAGNNLYDPDNLVGTYIINGSSVSDLSNWIPVKAKTKYVSDKAMTQYYFFDSEKNYLSVASYMTAPVVFTAQQDGFLLINLRGATDVVVVEGTTLSNHYNGYYALREDLTKRVSKADNNTWVGKKWLAIGDSLTDPQYASEGYPYLVSKALGMTLTNLGASGKVMNYFVDLIPDFADDFDLVTVLLGTNNQGYNCAIGSLNDGADYKSNSSFYAQTQKIAEVLMAKYPSAVIAFLTPIRRTGVEGQNNNDEGYMVNALGLTTEPYAEAVKEVADYYGLPCLDLYHNGINPKSEWMRQMYFVNSDGTHPNNEGHAKYTAPVIKAFLESLAPFGKKAVTYSVTNKLMNAANSNTATSVVEGSAYSANITANSGYLLSGVTVRMGDEDVTNTVYEDGVILIDKVTGNIVITVVTTEVSGATYSVTNNLTNAVNNNSAVSVKLGASYSAIITANAGYDLSSVTVTMGGTDITASAVNGGTIMIASVSGNIVILATATKNEVEMDESVLVHSYLGTSVPESGVLEDQTGTFDLKGTGTFMANYSNQEGLAIEAGDSVSFKFVNVARNTLYYTYACWLNTSGLSHWNLGINGNNDSSGRFSVSPCSFPENGSNGTFGDADAVSGYRDETGNEVKLYSGITWKKGETHTVTVTVNASDRTIKMYVDGEFTAESVMTCDLQVDGFTVCMNNDCPFERLEIYKGIVTNVG